MNRISIITRDGRPRFDILVDGRRLVEHFVGRLGGHPNQVVAIGWRDHNSSELEAVEQLLATRRSDLESGRVPVLVCEECGDLACGAIAVRIERHGNIVRWSDWAYENGYEPAKSVEYQIQLEMFEFDLTEYQRSFDGVAE